jgi:hypothetical protein
MRHAAKVIAAVGAAAFALSLSACGDDESTTSTSPSSTEGAPAGSASSTASNSGASGGKSEVSRKAEEAGKAGGTGKAGEKNEEGKSESPEEIRRAEAKEASEFVPKQHHDPGGGSKQFRVPKGFDNSVQEYGQEAGQSEFEEAAAAMHGYFDSLAARNWAAACQYTGKSVVESLEKLAELGGKELKDAGCAALMAATWDHVANAILVAVAKEADAGSLRVEGDHAFLIYYGQEKEKELLQMDREDGHWKVASLEGTAF